MTRHAYELAVGDWILYNNKPVRIEDGVQLEQLAMTDFDLNFDVERINNVYSYVFITPEILETNGFSKNGNIYILQGITYRVMVRKYIDADYLWDLSMSSLEDGSNLKGKTIRYVHQLQHFMRDFEIEKEIELCN